MKFGRKIFTISLSTLMSAVTLQTAAIAGGGGIIQASQSDAEGARAFQQLNENYNPPKQNPPPPLLPAET